VKQLGFKNETSVIELRWCNCYNWYEGNDTTKTYIKLVYILFLSFGLII